MNTGQKRKDEVSELAAKLYMARTGAKEAPRNKITVQDTHLAIVAIGHFEEKQQWEYGCIFSVDDKDSSSFPVWWTSSLKEVKEDLDWHVDKDKAAFPDRKWRVIKRKLDTGIEELSYGEQAELED